ncbi:hypothetical protein HYU89_02545 [Candidatus Collierbacteria bacterium]|nr:hypothetical protein [Candidatus Collierbacteria bacterium]
MSTISELLIKSYDRIKVLTFAFLFIVFFLWQTTDPAFAGNLLQNSGFEEGLNSWTVSPATATASATASTKHSGSLGGLLTKLSSSSWAYLSQKITVEPDKYYKFSGWGFLNDASITNIKLRFYWLDASQSKISSNPTEKELAVKGSDFQFMETESTLSPSTAQFADIQTYIYLNKANPVSPAIFDDLLFESVTPTPAPVPPATPAPASTSSPTSTPTPTSIPPTAIPSSIPTVKPSIILADSVSENSISDNENQPEIDLSINNAMETTPTNEPEVLGANSAKTSKPSLPLILIIAGTLLTFAGGVLLAYQEVKAHQVKK